MVESARTDPDATCRLLLAELAASRSPGFTTAILTILEYLPSSIIEPNQSLRTYFECDETESVLGRIVAMRMMLRKCFSGGILGPSDMAIIFEATAGPDRNAPELGDLDGIGMRDLEVMHDEVIRKFITASPALCGRFTVDSGAWVDAVKRYSEIDEPAGRYVLALCYSDGYGVPLDHGEAIDLLRKSAEAGFCPAQTTLGYVYMLGFGVEPSESQALLWLQMAAKKSDLAMRALTWMKENRKRRPG